MNEVFQNVTTVHLIIHQAEEDLHIDFPFDKMNDDIEVVVSELVETLGMTEADKPRIRGMIESQINPQLTFEPIGGAKDDSSDDEFLQTDAQYKALLEQQKHEMQNLIARQLQEKRELALRIQNQAMLMRGREGQKISFAMPVSPPVNPPSQPSLQSPTAAQGEAFEDLMSFD